MQLNKMMLKMTFSGLHILIENKALHSKIVHHSCVYIIIYIFTYRELRKFKTLIKSCVF